MIGNVPGQCGNVIRGRAHAREADAGAVAEADFRKGFRDDGLDVYKRQRLNRVRLVGTVYSVHCTLCCP